MADDIQRKLYAILAKQLGVDMANIKDDSALSDDLGADSLDMAEISMVVQDEFGLEIADEHLGKIKYVKDIVALLETNYAAK